MELIIRSGNVKKNFFEIIFKKVLTGFVDKTITFTGEAQFAINFFVVKKLV